jgi:hypothetical protein
VDAQTIVAEAIQEVNASADSGNLIDTHDATILLGAGSTADSLTLVSLLVAIERIAEEHTGQSITLVDEAALMSEDSPLATVGSLIGYLNRLLSA